MQDTTIVALVAFSSIAALVVWGLWKTRGVESSLDWPSDTPAETLKAYPELDDAISSYLERGMQLMVAGQLSAKGGLAGDPVAVKAEVDLWTSTLEALTMSPENLARGSVYLQPMSTAFAGHVELLAHLIQPDPGVRSVFRGFAERLSTCPNFRMAQAGERAAPFLEDEIPAGDPRLEKLEGLSEATREILSGESAG